MKKFLSYTFLLNWLIVSVIFQFNNQQTLSMFWIFFSLFGGSLFIALFVCSKAIADGKVIKTIHGNVLMGFIWDFLFFIAIAYAIQNNIQFNIVLLMVGLRLLSIYIAANQYITERTDD